MNLLRMASLMIMAATVGTLGCGTGGTTTGPDAGTGGGTGGGIGGSGGTDGGSSCPGQCVFGPPPGWTFPYFVWFGADKKDAPPCWPDAPLHAFDGYEGIDAPTDCGKCSCSPPTGSCSLPTTMTANAATCAQNGTSTPHTPFDPSSEWDGTCDTNQSIPSGKLCSGQKCVQSLTIGPLAISEGSCVPSQPPPQSAPKFKTFVRVCQFVLKDYCENPGRICIPSSQPEFRVCIFSTGDEDCVKYVPYSEKHLVFSQYDDTRACSACACGSPTGSTCSSTVSIFTDGACSTSAYSTPVTSAGSTCHDLPAGSPLGSKSATPPTYTPGTCAPSGGEPLGALTPSDIGTYCCLPTP